ncbi:ABC-three component system middle component 6 [Bacillus sp. NPDC057893]|uniref:ABC-three component system middle component 6 n=1 Tax=Bacillus sp. NPDC057893 TaxID=3346273 RepID=UPI00366FDD44
MILMDSDSRPDETILYLSALILEKMKKYKRYNAAFLDELFKEIDKKMPSQKGILALNFLFLLGKIDIEGEDVIYVP